MKTLKSAILSSSLLLSIKSVEGRTWKKVIDHALYQHIAFDTARVQLRIESDPFLETPHSSGLHNSLPPKDTSPPSASPTSSPCHEGSIHYQMNMYDTSGNGWQGTTIQVIGIENQDTVEASISSTADSSTYTTTTKLNTNEGNGYVSLSNTVQFGPGALLSNSQPKTFFPLGKIFESALTRGSSDHADICLVPRRCYDIVVHRGSTLEEVSWNLTAMVDNYEQEETAYIQGSAPMYCKFSIPDANGEVFCPIECSDEIPEKYTQNDASFADLLHPPVDKGNDGGFSALYRQFAGKDKLEKGEPSPKGKYSMFLAIGDKGEDEVETKPLDERPPAPVFDVDTLGLPPPPTEESVQDDPVEIENEESPTEEDTHTETENQGTPTTEEDEEISTETEVEDTPLETENQEVPAEESNHSVTTIEDEGHGDATPDTPIDHDTEPVNEDQGSQIETETSNPPADQGASGSFGESGSFLPLSGGDSMVQSAHVVQSAHEEGSETPSMDDDSLASQGLVEEDSNLPLTSEVRSADDIQMDKTAVIPEYNGTMLFQEEKAKIDVSESLPVDPTARAANHTGAPVKTDTFHMLLRHGGKR